MRRAIWRNQLGTLPFSDRNGQEVTILEDHLAPMVRFDDGKVIIAWRDELTLLPEVGAAHEEERP